MSEQNIKFIAADMDGTLLNSQGLLDPGFFELYEQLAERDIIFAAASGRQYYSLMETFKPIKDRMMFIAENGTLVMHQGKELYSCAMDTASVKAIVKHVRQIDGAYIVLSGKSSAYIETREQRALDEISKYYHECQQVDDLLAIDDEFIKVAICHFDGSQEHLHPSINELFGQSNKVVVSAKIWLDVMHSNASKGDALTYLQQHLEFSQQQTMSFGDYFNDVEMLQASYYSYAMENAHEGVKKHARYSAPSNNESGVIKAIQAQLKLG